MLKLICVNTPTVKGDILYYIRLDIFCTQNVRMWGVRVNIVVRKMQYIFFFIVGGIDVAVNNLKVFSVAMQQLQVCRNTFFYLLLSYTARQLGV